MIRVFEKSNPDFQRKLDVLCNRSSELTADVETAARKTIARVRAEGDAALRALTAEFDKRELGAIELPAAEWDELAARTTPDVRAAIERAAPARAHVSRARALRVVRDLRGRRARRQPRRSAGRGSASTSRGARRAIRRR